MIKLNAKSRPVRETEADWQYTDDDGNTVTEKTPVRFYCLTVNEIRAANDARRETIRNGEGWYISDTLLPCLESLPGLIDPATNKPVKITKEFLESQEAVNLQAVANAIDEDVDPKSKPAK